MADRDRLRELAAKVAAAGLGDPDDRGGVEVPEPLWGSLLRMLCDERLTGLALLARRSGVLAVGDDAAQDLLEYHVEALHRSLDHERALLRVGNAFDTAGINWAVLKGPSFAHCFYPDPSLRPFADLDVLVRTADWGAACNVLTSLGFRRVQPEPRPGFDVRFGKAATHRDTRGITVDLHRTLVIGPFGLRMDPAALIARTAILYLGGRAIPRLDDTGCLLNACLHAALGAWPPYLLPVRDVAQIATFGAVDWDRLAAWTTRWGLTAVIQEAFSQVRTDLGVAVPSPALQFLAAPVSRRDSRLLRAYQADSRERGGPAVATLVAIPGVSAKVAYLRALLFPSRSFVSTRADDSRSSYLRRWSTVLRWVSRRRHRS